GFGLFRFQALHFGEDVETKRSLVPEKPAIDVVRIFNVRVREEVVEGTTTATEMPGPADLARKLVLRAVVHKLTDHLAVQAIVDVAHFCFMHVDETMARKHLAFRR